MPKLDKKVATEIANTDAWEAGSGRQLLEDGRYAGQLFSVTERPGNVAPVWNWRFVNIHNTDGEMQGRSNQFLSTSLSPKSRGGMKQVFDAFGYTSDSDTDEMIGEWVVLYVVQEIQEMGKNAGKMVNTVKSVAPFDPEEWDFDPEAVPAYEERQKDPGSRPSTADRAADEF